jgi:hypothetical protein
VHPGAKWDQRACAENNGSSDPDGTSHRMTGSSSKATAMTRTTALRSATVAARTSSTGRC